MVCDELTSNTVAPIHVVVVSDVARTVASLWEAPPKLSVRTRTHTQRSSHPSTKGQQPTTNTTTTAALQEVTPRKVTTTRQLPQLTIRLRLTSQHEALRNRLALVLCFRPIEPDIALTGELWGVKSII